MKYILIVSLILILILFGCTEMTQSEKNLCYSLSTRSYDYIPNCTTEESCYVKVDSMFETNLMYTQETKLYEIKNKIARSWFYYNKAVKEIKNISKHCTSGSVNALSNSLTQMNFYLDKAFLELDQSVRQSFDIINYQEQSLSLEKIDLLKEEPIYESLIELRQILSELENGSTNSDSYISYYMEHVDNFNKNNSSAYRPVVENSVFWLFTYHAVDKLLLEKIGLGKTGQFPFLSDYFKKTIDYLEFNLYKEESLKSLISFPISDFMQLYSKLGGKENSALQRFSDLLNNISTNYSLLGKKQVTLLTEVNLLEKNLLEKYSNLNQDPTKTFIKSKLLASKIVPKSSYQEQITLLKKSLIEQNEHRAKGDLAIGEDIKKLKNLKNSYLQVTKSLEENVLGETGNLSHACDTFATIVEKKISGGEELANYITELTYLINKTKSSDTLKLDYCEKLILLEEEYTLGLKDYKTLESKKIDSTRDCFNYLETVFIYDSFFEIQNLFNELKNTQVTKENVLFFEEACKTLKNQVENELYSDAELKQIILLLTKTTNLFDEVNFNIAYFQDNKFENGIEKNSKSFVAIKNSIYTNNQLDFSKLLPIKKEFENKIKQIYETTLFDYENQIINFVQTTKEVVIVDDFVPTLGIMQQIQKRIILNNPFHEVRKSISINLSFSGKLLQKDLGISSLFEKQLILDYIPVGKTSADISTTENIELIEEVKHVLITNKNSIIQKTIELNSNTSFPKIIIQIEKPFGTYKTILFKNGFEQTYIETDANINFIGEFLEGEKLIAYFYMSNLITTYFEMLESYQTNNNTIQKFKVTMQNKTDTELNATLVFPFNYNKTLNRTILTNEKNEKLTVSVVNDEITVANELFLPKQTKQYYLTLEINDIFDYYQTELQIALTSLRNLGETTISEKISAFLLLVPGVDYDADAQRLLKQANKKISELEEEKLSDAEIQIAKDKLNEKIDELKENLKEANKLGLTNISSLENLLTVSLLSLESEDEQAILSALANLEKFTFIVSDELKESINRMWEKILENELIESDLIKLKDSFFDEKQVFDEIIAHDLNLGGEAYEKLKEIYSIFIKKEEELIQTNQEIERTLLDKINLIKKTVQNQVTFLENELVFSEEEMIKSKFVPPITNSRLKKINLELSGLDALDPLLQKEMLSDFSKELTEAIDYLKTKTVNEYNFAIDSEKPTEQIRKAKTFIDNNKYLSAYLLLKEDFGEVQTNYYFLIPIILIVVIGLFLRYKINEQKNKSSSKKTTIEKEWD